MLITEREYTEVSKESGSVLKSLYCFIIQWNCSPTKKELQYATGYKNVVFNTALNELLNTNSIRYGDSLFTGNDSGNELTPVLFDDRLFPENELNIINKAVDIYGVEYRNIITEHAVQLFLLGFGVSSRAKEFEFSFNENGLEIIKDDNKSLLTSGEKK